VDQGDHPDAGRVSRRVLKLCQERRGIQTELTYVGSRAMVVYELPLNEVVFDFYDRLKSITKGYASFDYQITGYEPGDLVQDVDPGQRGAGGCAVDARAPQPGGTARAGHVRKAEGPDPAAHVQDPDPGGHRRQGDRARNHPAMRKDVTAKCYGGDATRKRKLLDKQKAGKKKMRQFGKVEIPQEAFIQALKMDEN
jgi:GTP-binding protein LepA